MNDKINSMVTHHHLVSQKFPVLLAFLPIWASFWTWKAYHLHDAQFLVLLSYFFSEQYQVLGKHFLLAKWKPLTHFPRIALTTHFGSADVSPIPRVLHFSLGVGVTTAWHSVISRAESVKIDVKVFMASKSELGIINLSGFDFNLNLAVVLRV